MPIGSREAAGGVISGLLFFWQEGLGLLLRVSFAAIRFLIFKLIQVMVV